MLRDRRATSLTNCLRVIRNAWHFYHALRLVFKVACGGSVLRCSHLNRALCCMNKESHVYQENTFKRMATISRS
ncbi:DUF3265 domain-containing protein [Vibrio cholerae]|nr:DUF3265 domain-containing protein [Vibrio cholerae]